MSRLMRNEACASKHINIIAHYDDSTLVDKNSRLIRIFKLKGLNHLTKDKVLLDSFKNRRNNLLKSISSNFALYFWQIRKKHIADLSAKHLSGYASQVHEKYKSQLQTSAMFNTDIYVALIAKDPESMLGKGLSFVKKFYYAVDREEKEKFLRNRHKEISDLTRTIQSSFAEYDCELLAAYGTDEKYYSAPLEVISELINFEKSSVLFKPTHINSNLPKNRLFFNHRAGTIESRTADNIAKFSAMLSIKSYPDKTYHKIFDELLTLKCEFILTQSFRFYDKQVAKTRIRDQQHEMLQARDESTTQTDKIHDAFDQTASGEVGYGMHHFTLACYADTQEELNHNVGMIVAKLTDVDVVCVREDMASELEFWAQLPGNFGYIPRPADISTKNIASFASLHNYPLGKSQGNHWGEAVTLFETISGSPYYFNFHYRDVGNFLIFGAMGSGKTVLVGFLLLESMKFGGKRIIFDKDRGMEILVSAMDGTYISLKPGKTTGFNPCHLTDTSENRQFLFNLFKKILTSNGEILTDADLECINNAIEGLYRMDKKERQFAHLASFFGFKGKHSLRARFDQWHSEGPFAWLFDNEMDYLDLNADVLGFDLSYILAQENTKTPALMYLIHRIEQALEGQRGILFADEGSRLLENDYLNVRINDWSRTPRKKDNIFGLATQVANDTVHHSISKSINESAFCKIFFPNPSADRKVYIDDLGLNEHEYQLIKTLPDDQHYFLLNHGRSTNKESVILRLNLSELEDEIPVISGREKNLAIFDQVRKEVGYEPDKWLPVFKARVNKAK